MMQKLKTLKVGKTKQATHESLALASWHSPL